MFNKLANWIRGIRQDTKEDVISMEELDRKLDALLEPEILKRKIFNRNLSSEALREQLQGITTVDIGDDRFFGIKEGESLSNFLGEASQIHELSAFKTVLEGLLQRQIMWTVNHSNDWNEAMFGRFTINGIHLVMEQFDLLDAEYKERFKPSEDFDKHEIL